MPQDTQCPKCNGAMWDNRSTKRNPKQPDFKCKDRECTGVIWPPKNGTRPAPPPAPAPNAKGAYSGGPHIPELDGPQENAVTPDERFTKIADLYTKSYKHASSLALEQFGADTSDVAVSSMTATLFIQACDAGLHR